MGFHNDGYATVWSTAKKSDTMTTVRISTSRKNKNTDKYEQDFSGFVAFVGRDNAAAALTLHEKDRIKLSRVDVSSHFDKEKNKEFINYTCFGFELASAPHTETTAEQPTQEVDNGEVLSDDDTPF